LITALITLGLNRFERVQTERGADQNSSKDDSDRKVTSHGTWFFLSGGVKENNPDGIGAQEPPKSYSNHSVPKRNSKNLHAPAHAGFAEYGFRFPGKSHGYLRRVPAVQGLIS
jgi:hypothetical protein